MEVDRRTLLVGAVVASAPVEQGSRIAPRLLGAWTFLDGATINAGGRETPWTASRHLDGGLLIFAPGGYFSLQLAALPAYVAATPELPGFAERWFGCFGKFAVDEDRRELSMEIVGSYVFSELSSNRPRKIELAGNVLAITKPPPPSGELRSNRLRWTRT